MRRLAIFATIGVICVALAFAGYFIYDARQTDKTVDLVYDWMQTRGTATATSKGQIRAWIADVQTRYGISAADARKAVRDYTIGGK
ncbi:MAG TPA: hypothetical protein VFW46_16390 [Stellaceae bacterium]|nr:hypothetical protein [Stellaceae bacterium]